MVTTACGVDDAVMDDLVDWMNLGLLAWVAATFVLAGVVKGVSGMGLPTLAMALKGAREDVKAHIFRAMSSRAVEMLKEDMEVLGPVRTREVTLAQYEILNLARKLEADGKVILKIEQGDDLLV